MSAVEGFELRVDGARRLELEGSKRVSRLLSRIFKTLFPRGSDAGKIARFDIVWLSEEEAARLPWRPSMEKIRP